MAVALGSAHVHACRFFFFFFHCTRMKVRVQGFGVIAV